MNLSSGGIRKVMGFFSTFYDVFKLGLDENGHGFFDRLSKEHLDEEFLDTMQNSILKR